MSECTHDCEHCTADCSSNEGPKSFIESCNQYSNVKHVYAVVSGKGGVGKSLVTSMLASNMQKKGYSTAILDADITGPSIPKMFGVKERARGNGTDILSVATKSGIKLMSLNLLMDNETDPVVWRGPVIAGTVKQFWTNVVWGQVDYMFVDMPPGTGDVPLTVFQSIPLDGIIIVTSPQDLVSMIVEKAVRMAGLMNIPVVGIVENMSYFKCPNCGENHSIFGNGHIEEIADKYNIKSIAKLPIDPQIASECDKGNAEGIDAYWLDELIESLEKAAD